MTTETTTNETRRLFTRELRTKLTEGEITERGRKLAARRQDHHALDEKRKATNKDFGGQLAQISAELDSLQSAINTGTELRPVQCYEEWRAGVVEIRRADTGEVLDTRIPTLSEQQVGLPVPGLDDDEPKDGAAGEGGEGGEGGDAGEGEGGTDGDEDFGGAVGRGAGKKPKLEIVKSATGGEVAHMPDDDEGEAPDPAALGGLGKPAAPAGKGGKGKGSRPRKAK